MDWNPLVTFIDDRNPQFSTRIRGVSSSVLEELERGLTVDLPSNYVSFLKIMGGDTDGFDVFPGCHYLPEDLLRRRPSGPLAFPAGRFFRVAARKERDALYPDDYFLDLGRSDGADAPLVGFALAAQPTAYDELAYSFVDHVQWRAFETYALKPSRVKKQLSILATTASEAHSRLAEVVSVLLRMGFEEVIAATEHLWCGVRGEASATAELGPDEPLLITIDLGAAEPKEMDSVTAILLDNTSAEVSAVRLS